MSSLTRRQIESLIPHRAPILLLDAVTDWEADKWLEATLKLSPDSPHFHGHFPGNPIFPGVLLVEAMAQAAAVLISLTRGIKARQAVYLFTGIDETKFGTPLLPGAKVMLRVEKQREKLNVFRFHSTAISGDKIAAQSTITAKLIVK
jgi:3-hydroxyacyl-[acyl-carrier-protein] dehydratase